MKKYLAVYFYKERHEEGLGNVVVEIDGKITSENEVRAIEGEVKKSKNIKELVLLNLIALDEETEESNQ